MPDIALDLDALAPHAVEINYQQKKIQVQPPTLEQFAQIVNLSNDMSKLSVKGSFDSALPVYAQALVIIREVIPEFKDTQLNYMQIMALFKLLGDMASPDDDRATAELKKRGIDITTVAKEDKNPSPKALAS